MGYKMANRVVKNRRKGMVGEYEICLDEVEDLGTFIEVEKMAEEDIEQVRKELLDFTISLGVSLEDEVKRGYDILILEKQEKND
jgi:adenylate cyclase class 2